MIYDLRHANPRARINVKLVSEVGVGTVAAGVTKAGADVVLVSGHDGGTGAAPLTSIRHAGAPWELGLAETHQTLVANGLRDRVVVQVDGQLRTGRDVVIAALLGAQEFGFATAPLVVSGCVMMRVCHLDTCPVGIATQRPDLRERFTGKPEFIETFFTFLAEQVRELLASLGLRSLDEALGRTDLIEAVFPADHDKAATLDLGALLAQAPPPVTGAQKGERAADLDDELLELIAPSLEQGTPVTVHHAVRNVDRAVGTRIGYHLTRRHPQGLADDTVVVRLEGSAGQSLGAFLPRGITLSLTGDANDYLGKGLSGGRIVVRPDPSSPFRSDEAIIAGNVVAYGATSGEIFARGLLGERFCVRNSGAVVVAEGVGDHGCEYMTGGRAVILGPTGRNFAAGMSGGLAFVYDAKRAFEPRCNLASVDLEPIDAEDDEWLTSILRRFVTDTRSILAAGLLEDWRSVRSDFVAVVPHGWREAEAARSEVPTLAGAMRKPTGFLEHPRELPQRRPVEVRLRDFSDVYERPQPGFEETQATRCMDCGIPFCHAGCPLGNLIPEWNGFLPTDVWRRRRAAARRRHFPEFTGALCPAPCEAAWSRDQRRTGPSSASSSTSPSEPSTQGWSSRCRPPSRRAGVSGCRFRARRPRRRTAARARGSRGDGLRASRAAGRAPAIRDPVVQAREVRPRQADRAAGGRGSPLHLLHPGRREHARRLRARGPVVPARTDARPGDTAERRGASLPKRRGPHRHGLHRAARPGRRGTIARQRRLRPRVPARPEPPRGVEGRVGPDHRRGTGT